jgi:hypothetical protein
VGQEDRNTSIWIAVVGAILAALQVVVLFILSDMRDRIMRLESQQMTRPAALAKAVQK